MTLAAWIFAAIPLGFALAILDREYGPRLKAAALRVWKRGRG